MKNLYFVRCMGDEVGGYTEATSEPGTWRFYVVAERPEDVCAMIARHMAETNTGFKRLREVASIELISSTQLENGLPLLLGDKP